MPRIINGQYFEDGKPGTRVINTNGGNYTECIKGDVIQGEVIVNGQVMPKTPKRKDLSKDGAPAIDVEVKND